MGRQAMDDSKPAEPASTGLVETAGRVDVAA
jgi:hypothetical protein